MQQALRVWSVTVRAGVSALLWRSTWPASALHARRGVATEAVQEDDIYTSDVPPPHFVTPAASVQHLRGRGRALVATAPLHAGDPVMIVQPLAILHGPADEMPDPDGLVPLLQQASGTPIQGGSGPKSRTQQWLHLLYRGPSSMPQQPREQAVQLQKLQGLLRQSLQDQGAESNEAASATSASTGPETPGSDQSRGASGMSEEDLEGIVAYNAFGDAFEDLAAFECRSSRRGHTSSTSSSEASGPGAGHASEAQSHVGVWPHFSLLNHSCVPSCVHFVVGSTMVVRAVADIPAGQELTISYLGREDFSPASVRQHLLHSRYGFLCQCPRCLLESCLPVPLRELLGELHLDTRMTLAPALLRAAEQDDGPALEQVGSSLVEWSTRLHHALAAFKKQLHPPMAPSTVTPTAASQQATQQPLESQPASLPPILQSGDHQPGQVGSFLSPSAGSQAIDTVKLRQAVAAVGGADVAVLMAFSTVYDFIELLHQHAQLTAAGGDDGDAGGPPSNGQQGVGAGSVASSAASGDRDLLGSLRLSTDILHAVSRGSELHVFQTSRLLQLANEDELSRVMDSEALVATAQAAEEALLCRYGPVTPALMVELAQLNARISQQFVV